MRRIYWYVLLEWVLEIFVTCNQCLERLFSIQYIIVWDLDTFRFCFSKSTIQPFVWISSIWIGWTHRRRQILRGSCMGMQCFVTHEMILWFHFNYKLQLKLIRRIFYVILSNEPCRKFPIFKLENVFDPISTEVLITFTGIETQNKNAVVDFRWFKLVFLIQSRMLEKVIFLEKTNRR